MIPELAEFLPGPNSIHLLFRQLSLVSSVYMYKDNPKFNWESQDLVAYTLLYYAIKYNGNIDQSTLSSCELTNETTHHSLSLNTGTVPSNKDIKLSYLLGLHNVGKLKSYATNLKKYKDKPLKDAMAECASKKTVFLVTLFIMKISQDEQLLLQGKIDPALSFRQALDECRRSKIVA